MSMLLMLNNTFSINTRFSVYRGSGTESINNRNQSLEKREKCLRCQSRQYCKYFREYIANRN